MLYKLAVVENLSEVPCVLPLNKKPVGDPGSDVTFVGVNPEVEDKVPPLRKVSRFSGVAAL